MKVIQLGLSIAILILLPAGANADRTLYTVSSQNNGGPNLRAVNSLTGATIVTIPITLSGFTVVAANGLARDPTTGKLYALLRVTGAASCVSSLGGGGGSIPRLATINPATGVATDVGSAGDCFSGLAFSSNGTLYGVTGDGGNVAESLYTFNKTNAVRTLVATLGNGSDGEAIGFNPDDGLIYHASGNDTFTIGPQVFESINPGNLAAAPVDIPRSGDDYVEALALTYQGGNKFLLTDGAGAPSRLLTMTTGGVATPLGSMDHDAKGLAFTPKPQTDFDADVKSDISIYRNGVWYILQSTDGALISVGLGAASGDVPVHADYDGDGEVDPAVFRNGLWFIRQSSNGALVTVGLGTTGDVPVPGDYDGDGKTDQAVFRNGLWFIRQSSNGALVTVGLGTTGDVPVPGDYDGDGKTDQAVFRNGLWFIRQSSNGALVTVGLGTTGDVPVSGDYDGDGKTDPAVFRNGLWFIRQSSNGALVTVGLGTTGDVPVPGDYDGDGKTDQAVFRNGLWFIRQSSNGVLNTVGLGMTGDVPLK